MVEGKTKTIKRGPRPHTVLLITKDVLTGGDAARVAQIDDIGLLKTEQAANVFELLNRAGVPTAFIEKHDQRSLLCWDCEMLPLECVMRRFAFGSYVKRRPEFRSDGIPHRFDEPLVELFHKHTLITPPNVNEPVMTREDEARSKYLRDGQWAEGVYTDPFINPTDEYWALHSAKAPFDPLQPLHRIEPLLSSDEVESLTHELLLPAFRTLEEAWRQVETVHGEVVLVDIKVEVGRRRDNGQFVLADVIDNDSWRIWPGGDPSQQLDKQCFRDNEPLSKVADNYKLVNQLTAQLLTAR